MCPSRCGSPCRLLRLSWQGPGGTGGAEFDGDSAGAGPAHLLGFLTGGLKADLESFDLAEPAAFGGLADALVQAGDDLCQADALPGGLASSQLSCWFGLGRG